MKIVFFGTSWVGVETLKALHVAHEVVAVVTNPDAPVGRKQILTSSPISVLATELGLVQLKPDKVKGNAEFLQSLEKLNADVFIVVSYGKILPKELIDSPPLKTLNIHFSLLPKYRGAAPIQATLLAGDEVSGTTIFILDELLDHGPILAQKEVVIAPNDTFTSLAQKMASESTEMLLELLPRYEKGQVSPIEQDHNKATKVPMIKKADGRVDWNNTASEIYNMHRAYFEWPGIFTLWQGKLLKILNCLPASPSPTEERVGVRLSAPGTVLPDGRVACGDGTILELVTVQLEGKKPVDIKTFLSGNKEFVGTSLMIQLL